MPASDNALDIFAPRPGLSVPSIRKECRLPVIRKPAASAAFTGFAPFNGVTNTTPLPGCSGARRAMTNSKLDPAAVSAANFPARPPARSSMLAAHTSTVVTFSFITALLLVGFVFFHDQVLLYRRLPRQM